LQHHLKEATNQSIQERIRRRTRGLCEINHPWFVTSTKREAILVGFFGTQRYLHFVGIKEIKWHISRRRKIHAIGQISLRGGMKRRLLQCNNKLACTCIQGL